jgi:hypothetical protein
MKLVVLGVVIGLSVLAGTLLLVRHRQPPPVEVVSEDGTLRATLEDGRTFIRVREADTGKEVFILRAREKLEGPRFLQDPQGTWLYYSRVFPRCSYHRRALVRPNPNFHQADPSGPRA